MTWDLSQFRAGDLVQIRSKAEILATLDESGSVDGMPFMPEMLQYCGKVVPVAAVAHKTCDTAQVKGTGRRLEQAVHLTGLRCDGSAHGGCQAACNLFWKDAWLKPVIGSATRPNASAPRPSGCDEEQLRARTLQTPLKPGEDPRYSCQATRLYDASTALPWWNVRQYILDVITGNFSARHVARVLVLTLLKHTVRRAPIGYRPMKRLYERVHRWLTGRDVPEVAGPIARDARTPTGRLDLKAGERVRIKSRAEILATVNEVGQNRGLSFDVEMAPYCGQTATVRTSVTAIIDETTGKMRRMKQPCIMLDGVVCGSEYSQCRLMCPRAIPSYWRELWLERVDSEAGPVSIAGAAGVLGNVATGAGPVGAAAPLTPA